MVVYIQYMFADVFCKTGWFTCTSFCMPTQQPCFGQISLKLHLQKLTGAHHHINLLPFKVASIVSPSVCKLEKPLPYVTCFPEQGWKKQLINNLLIELPRWKHHIVKLARWSLLCRKALYIYIDSCLIYPRFNRLYFIAVIRNTMTQPMITYFIILKLCRVFCCADAIK